MIRIYQLPEQEAAAARSPAGERVLSTAQLIDGQSDRHLWAERYERPFEDVLKLQGEVAQHIVEQAGVTVSADEAERLSVDRTVDPETYRAYLRGMPHR